MTTTTEKKSGGSKALTVVGIVLCVVLIPILLANLWLIVSSLTRPDEVPGLLGVTPMVVLSDSMYPGIQSGDLILCRDAAAETVQVGDVIAFFDPEGSGTSVVTHRVIEIVTEDGALSFRTKGDANNAADRLAVPAEKLVGVYRSRLPGLGNVTMFMQTTTGLIVCVVCPILLLVGWDVLRRRRYDSRQAADRDALLAELEALRAAQADGTETEKKP